MIDFIIKGRVRRLEISNINHNYMRSNTIDSKERVTDYIKKLKDKYNYFGKTASVCRVPTMVNVSGAFLNQCTKDSEKARYLEENLEAIPQSILKAKSLRLGSGRVLVNASYNIDENGNISMTTTSTNDPDEKIAEENARKKAEEKKKKSEQECIEKIENLNMDDSFDYQLSSFDCQA